LGSRIATAKSGSLNRSAKTSFGSNPITAPMRTDRAAFRSEHPDKLDQKLSGDPKSLLPSRGKPAHASGSWPLSWAGRPIGASAWASPARRRATLSRLERALAHSSSETERLSSPYLPEAGKSGGSHDTAESLVARYFDCVALPLGGDAALPRLRMKRAAWHVGWLSRISQGLGQTLSGPRINYFERCPVLTRRRGDKRGRLCPSPAHHGIYR
jgi:hypothetical protein